MGIEQLDYNMELNAETLGFLDDKSFNELITAMEENPEKFPDAQGDLEEVQESIAGIEHEKEGAIAYETNEFWNEGSNQNAIADAQISESELKNRIEFR